MANKRISSLGSLGGTPAVGDIIPITDISDTAGSAQGTTKKVTVANLVAAAPVQSVAGRTGTVTLSNTDVSGLGTAALLDSGTSNGNVVVLDSTGLPAVDGSQLTNIATSFSNLQTYASSGRPASPSNGDIYYETDTHRLLVYNSTLGVWRYYSSDGSIDVNEISNLYSSKYDGTNDYGEAAIASNSMSGDFTLSFWFYGASTSLHTMMEVNYGSNPGWGLIRKGSNTLHLYHYYSGGSGWVYNGIASGISDNTWTHIMLARTGSSLKTYVGGSLLNTSTLSNNISFSGANLESGVTYPGSAINYLDEIAVWSSDQSSNIGQIRSAANKPKNLDVMTTNPLYWWRQGEDNSGSGTTISNNAQATGGSVSWELENGALIDSANKA